MAKKKTKSVTKPVEKTKKKQAKISQENMKSKVEVKKVEDPEKISRIVGTIFIVLGILLVGFGIYSFVKYNSNPELDSTLVPPSLIGTETISSDGTISVKGYADGYSSVRIYVNGEEKAKVKVSKEGEFESDIQVDKEGLYAITVSGIKGFPRRYMSSQSTITISTVDWTAPVLSSVSFPEEVGSETFTVTGVVESGATVIIKRGTDYYSTTCDSEGKFKITGILLEEGANVFNVEIKDLAGNITNLEKEIKVTYSLDSDVDGDAVDDSSLPIAAGELDSALDFVNGNNLMIIFASIALFGLLGSSTIVYIKAKRKED